MKNLAHLYNKKIKFYFLFILNKITKILFHIFLTCNKIVYFFIKKYKFIYNYKTFFIFNKIWIKFN